MGKIKYCLGLTAVVFLVGGMWFPILYGASSFTILNFLITGITSVALMWVGGAAIHHLAKKTQPKA